MMMECYHSFVILVPTAFSSQLLMTSDAFAASGLELEDDDDVEGNAKKTTQIDDGRPSNLVDQQSLIDSTEYLKKALAFEQGIDYQPEEGVDAYAIARTKVNLQIDREPGLDLTESLGLVIVSGVSQSTYDLGIKPLDTIVGVKSSPSIVQNESDDEVESEDKEKEGSCDCCGGKTGVKDEDEYEEQCTGADLDTIARILQTASRHALESGRTVIELELNRLFKLSYAD